MRKYRRTISVDVDVNDVLDNIDDNDLLDECRERELLQPANIAPQPYVEDYVQLAHEALMAGRASSALALLDRALFPTGAEKTAEGQLVFKRSA